MTKPRTAKVKANLIVAQGNGWRVEFDRGTKDYASYVDGCGYIGSSAKPLEAQQRCHEYLYRQLASAAA
jgi:hypothetical protein